jgi:hypothetical protein
MSNEFRHISPGGYLHSVLADQIDEMGRHPVSQSLARLYYALAPVERCCAAFEAGDAGPDRVTEGLVRHWKTVRSAVTEIGRLLPVGVTQEEQEDDEWFPLHTAPVNETVLVWCERFQEVVTARNYDGEGWKTWGVNGVFSCRPTHWRHLPKPPSGRIKGAGKGEMS